MKIVHLIDYFQPKVGYQEYFLALYQQKSGHEIEVITSDKYYPFANYNNTYSKLLGQRKVDKGEYSEESVKVKRLSSREIIPGSFIILEGLYSALKSFQPRVVFCHNIYSLTSILAAFYRKNLNYQLIYDTHSSPFNTNFNDRIVKRIYHSFFRMFAVPLIVRNAKTIFAIGEEERKFICRDLNIPLDKVPIIRLGVDTDKFKFIKTEREITRKQLGVDNDDLLIIFSGKVSTNKNVHLIFQAVKKLKSNKIKILILGGGETRYIKNLRKILPGKMIIWKDLITNNKLPPYYCASDVGIWPGDPSISMLEAMSCRLPLILPDRDKETEYLDSSQGILRFKRNNSESLAEKIKYLQIFSKNKNKMANNAQKYIKNYLSWDIIANKTLKLLNN